MSTNLILGCATIAASLAVQCAVVAILLRVLIRLERKGIIRPTFAGISSLVMLVLMIILAGNLLQMTLWAGLFVLCGEFHDFPVAFYHSAVNFTTLGYGDVVMSQGKRLLGALEAANGVMMFGLTTSLLYTVLSALVRRAWESRTSQKVASAEAPAC